MKRYISRLWACFALIVLAACGGGGGGGGSGAAGGGVGGGKNFNYSGDTSAAVITGTNAAKLTTDVLGGQATGSLIVGASKATSSESMRHAGIVDVIQRIRSRLQTPLPPTFTQSIRRQATAVTIDQ